MTERQRLHHLLDRARHGALLPVEGEALAVLVGELEKSAAINAEVDARADEQLNSCTEVAQYYKALSERTQTWGEQHRDRANRYRTRTEAVRAELTALNSETAGLNPYAMAGRRDAVARIRAALQSVSHDTPVPADPRVTELEAEVARLTGGQCTHALAMCERHHTQPVDGCPYPRCIKAREQREAECTGGRPTHPDGTPYRYHEIVAGGWSRCDGCRTWSQDATPENPHECPMTHIHGPDAA